MTICQHSCLFWGMVHGLTYGGQILKLKYKQNK